MLERALARGVALGDVVREAEIRARLAYVAYLQNQTAAATQSALSALALWKQHRERFTPARAVATLHTAAATILYVNPTDTAHREYLEACVAIVRATPQQIEATDAARCLYGLGTSYAQVDSRYDEADAVIREALALQPAEEQSSSLAASMLQMLGFANRYRGRFAEDERAQRESYEITARLQGADSMAALWQRAVWIASLPGVGRAEEAYREAQTVLAAARKVYPTRGSYLMWTPLSSAMYAACMTERYAECEALALEGIATLGPEPAATDMRLLGARGFLGLALSQRGRHAEAKPMLEAALAANAARKRTSPYTPMLEAALAAASRP
jgi:tetratricopeptide (TPR) repeat protein